MTITEIVNKLEQHASFNSMRLLAEQASDTILLIDRNHQIIWINRTGRSKYGLTADWWMDEQALRFCHNVIFGWDHPCHSNGCSCPVGEFLHSLDEKETQFFRNGILYRIRLIANPMDDFLSEFYWEVIHEIAPQDRIDYQEEEYKVIPYELLSILDKNIESVPPRCMHLDDMRATGSILSNLIEKLHHPIGMMLCSFHNLLDRKSDADQPQQIKMIYNEILTLRAITYQMMAFMQSFKLDFNPVNVNRLITDTLIVVLSQNDYTNVAFNNNLSNSQDYILGDVISLKFAIQCLLGIILECVVQQDEPQMMIHSEQRNDGQFVQITFESDGLNIPSSQLDSLCQRMDPPTHSYATIHFATPSE